jgi:hypothetical protein
MNDDLSFPTAQTKVPVEYLTQAIAQLALGVWLVIGSRGIMNIIRKGRDSIKAE